MGSDAACETPLSPLIEKIPITEAGTIDRFTEEELAEYNGKDGAPAYIAYKGKFYDVTNSFLGRNGRHWVLHTAGKDFTDSLDQAPHGEDLWDRVPIVGILSYGGEDP